MYTYVYFELFNLNISTVYAFYIQDVHVHTRPVSPGFVKHIIMPDAYVLLNDMSTVYRHSIDRIPDHHQV